MAASARQWLNCIVLPGGFFRRYFCSWLHEALAKVRQAVESDKLAKMAKEEADDALDDVEAKDKAAM